MKIRNRKKPTLKSPRHSPTRIDPTRTITLRRQMATRINQMYARLKLDLYKLIVEEDALGLKESNHKPFSADDARQPERVTGNEYWQQIPLLNSFCPTGKGGGVDATCSPSKLSSETKPIPVDRIVAKLKELGADALHLEHVAKDYVSEGVAKAIAKLPAAAQTVVTAAYFVGKVGGQAAFASWIVSQALAERVARAKGFTKEEAKKLRGVLTTLDVIAVKPISIGISALAGPIAGVAASFIAPATASYLARSTSKDPMATARAAKGMVRDAVRQLSLLGRKVMRRVKHDVEELKGSYDLLSVNSFCPTGPGGGIDPTCSPSGSINSISEADKWGKQHFSDWVHSLSASEKFAISAYVGGGYESINRDLRDGVPLDKTPGKTKEVVTGLDTAIAKSHAPHDMTVYRGIRGELADSLIESAKSQGEFADKSFFSSTIVKKQANEFSSRKGMTNAIIELDIPKGTSGIYPDTIEIIGGEAEWLMPRNMPIKLVSAEKQDDGRWSIKAKVMEKMRETVSVNSFCPTGKGGGIDPTCSPIPSMPSTEKDAEEIANKLREHLVETDSCAMDGDCQTQAMIMIMKYPEAEVWSGDYEQNPEQHHLIVKLGDFFIDVTADQFPNGPPIKVFYEDEMEPGSFAEEYGGFHRSPGLESSFKDMTQNSSQEDNITNLLADTLQQHWFSDWWIALFSTALDETKKFSLTVEDVLRSVALANVLYAEKPIDPVGHLGIDTREQEENAKEVLGDLTDNVFCTTGEGGGVDPTCSRTIAGYHGTSKKSADKIREAGFDLKEGRTAYYGAGVYMVLGEGTETESETKFYGEEQLKLETEVQNPYIQEDHMGFEDKGHMPALAGPKSPFRAEMVALRESDPSLGWGQALTKILQAKGYDSVITWEDGKKIAVIFDPKDIAVLNTRWQFTSDPAKIDAFQSWLKQQMQTTLHNQTTDDLWKKYIEAGWRKGAARAFDDTNPKVRQAMQTDQGAVADFYRGTKDQFLRSSFNQPISLDRLKVLIGRTFTDLKGVDGAMATAMSRTLADGLVQGKSPIDIARDLANNIEGIGRARALLIAQTECLPGDTLVDTAVVRAVFRRWYEGDMIEIETRSGRKFSATPNHPMLTRGGWVAAGLLNQGDYLVSRSGNQDLSSSGDVNVKRGPTPISEIFDSLNAVVTVERKVCNKMDFHGDGMEGEIDILCPDMELFIGNFSSIGKELIEKVFSLTDNTRLPLCSLCGRLLSVNKQPCLCQSSKRNTKTGQPVFDDITINSELSSESDQGLSRQVPSSELVSSNILSVLIPDPSPIPRVELPFGISSTDPRLAKDTTNSLLVRPNLFGDFPLSEAAQVEFDDVVSVTIRPFSGHVYNLETPFGYYTIDQLYTGNCIRAHAEGQLQTLEDMGVKDVGVMVEWDTTGDKKVCPRCKPMQGVVLKIDEARGMIPRHPRCRCAWVPAQVGESTEGQKKSQAKVEDAIDISISIGGKKRNLNDDEWGPAQPISKQRPKSKVSPVKNRNSKWMPVNRIYPPIRRGRDNGVRPSSLDDLYDDITGGWALVDGVEKPGGLFWNNEWTPLGNAFCPTGIGGGVDPTCSPGGTGGTHNLHTAQGLSDYIASHIPDFTKGQHAKVMAMLPNGVKGGIFKTANLTTPQRAKLKQILPPGTRIMAGTYDPVTMDLKKKEKKPKAPTQSFTPMPQPPATTPTPTPTLPVVPFSPERKWETEKPEPGILNGIPFASAPPKFWENTKDVDVKEPPPLRTIDRVGVMIKEPDGRVWIVQPTGKFGNRTHTLPGGGVEHGLTNQQNAMKEVWEETGLQVKITGHLGDFKDSNNGNNGRLYVGERIGGAPWDAKIDAHIRHPVTGKPTAESESVTLVTPERAAELLHRTDDLAQLATAHPIALKTKTDGNVMKKIVEGITPTVEKYKKEKRAKRQEAGDPSLKVIQDMRGFSDKPQVVSKKDMDSLMVKGDHIEMMRGIGGSYSGGLSGKDLAETYRTGDHHPGYGIFGDGTYADATKGGSNVVSGGRYGGGSNSGVLRIALPKSAKIIESSELERVTARHPNDYDNGNGGAGSKTENWRGVHAALAGYDAIHIDGKSSSHGSYGNPNQSKTEGFYVILNRSIVTVQKEDAAGHTIR